MLIEISLIRDLVTIFGVIAGFTYYALTVRHQNQSRGAQLFLEMYRDFKAVEVQDAFNDIIFNWEWDSYEDFLEKYGRIKNWEEWRKYILIYTIYEGLGVLIYRNIIDVTMIEQLMRSYVVRFWEKMRPIIYETRERYGLSLMAEWTEYLYEELMKIESKPAYTLKT
jgi:hypothetical protein